MVLTLRLPSSALIPTLKSIRVSPRRPSGHRAGLPDTRGGVQPVCLYKGATQGHGSDQAPQGLSKLSNSFLGAGLSLAACTTLLLAPAPSQADIQYVPADQLTTQAKPLTLSQPVEKKKVWTLFIGGAVFLFGATLAVENNESWFPAIARANMAMRNMKFDGAEGQLTEELYTEDWAGAAPEASPKADEVEETDSSLSAVVAGIQSASEAARAEVQESVAVPTEKEKTEESTPQAEDSAAPAETEKIEGNIPKVLEGGDPLPQATDDAAATPAPTAADMKEDAPSAVDGGAISLDALEAALAERMAEKEAAKASAATPAEPSLESLQAELETRLKAAEKGNPPESTSSDASSGTLKN